MNRPNKNLKSLTKTKIPAIKKYEKYIQES